MSSPSTTRTATASHTTDRYVDSEWWKAIALAGAFFVFAYVVGLLLFLTVFVPAVIGLGDPAGLLGVGFGLAFLVFVLLALVGLVLSLLLPVALYFDAQAVTEANVGWRPDPTLFAGVAALGLFVQIVQPAVAFYYLYKRRQAVGTP
ncbi:hypothetical protein [Halomarina oriensis]|uniref:Uncharacterized protein n=1 Tax=Halomarina oriensis TaxID=671145 RepID=A0A6B0GHV4_9EURY|nr:hypothetical protein [Halomarina oriensis]MWG34446.1 hypothetical protein [Halomarina oriensis]